MGENTQKKKYSVRSANKYHVAGSALLFVLACIFLLGAGSARPHPQSIELGIASASPSGPSGGLGIPASASSVRPVCVPGEGQGSVEVTSGCSASCGDGTQSTLITYADCSTEVGSQSCNLGACPATCTPSEVVTSGCSASCGDGTRSTLITYADCSTSVGSQSCNVQPCARPIDGTCGASRFTCAYPPPDNTVGNESDVDAIFWTWTCFGSNGGNHNYSCRAPKPPTADIKANGSDADIPIPFNGPVNITWGSTNANSCTVTFSDAGGSWSGTWGDRRDNLVASRTYALSCSGPGGGPVTDRVTVNVSPPSYFLTVNKIGSGSVGGTNGLTCPVGVSAGCGLQYTGGTVVTLTATPASNFTFTDWSGDCSAGGTVTMDRDKTCTATFTMVPQININATLDGNPWSGTVTMDYLGDSSPCAAVGVPYVGSTGPGLHEYKYCSGGPLGATFTGITPSSAQTVPPGGSITRWTFNFVTPPVNRPPDANAGPDQSVNEGAVVTLNGSGSDPDGDSLTYSWVQDSNNPQGSAAVTLSSPTGTRPVFVAPLLAPSAPTSQYRFWLTVSDGKGGTDTDDVVITVNDAVRPTVDLNVRRISPTTSWDRSNVEINVGQHVELQWETRDATRCVEQPILPTDIGTAYFDTGPGELPNDQTSGPAGVAEPLSGTKRYRVRCFNGPLFNAPSRTDDVIVTVNTNPVIIATPTLVNYKGKSKITWRLNGLANCSIRGTNGDTLGLVFPLSKDNTSPGVNTTELSGETIYTITCTGGSDSETIRVRPQFEEI